MLDLKFVRENPDIVKQNIKNKFQDRKLPLVDEVIELDAQARATKTEADELRANRNKLSKQIGALMAQGKKEEAEAVKAQVNTDADRLKELEAKEKSYVKVRTSNGKKAAECLSKELQLDASYNADDDTIYIYFENNAVYPTEKISRFLFEMGYDLYSLEIVKTTLEDFFIELLGGTTIE